VRWPRSSEHALHIGNTKIGLLSSVSLLIATAAASEKARAVAARS
jgi:hypothetical protein